MIHYVLQESTLDKIRKYRYWGDSMGNYHDFPFPCSQGGFPNGEYATKQGSVFVSQTVFQDTWHHHKGDYTLVGVASMRVG